MQILLPEAYLSYPELGKPVTNEMNPEQAPRFKATFIFPKGTDLTELNAKIEELKAEMGRPPKHCCLKECAQQIDKDTGLIKALYDQGDYYLNAWSSESHPPALIDSQNKPGYHASNYKGGNLVQAIVNLWQTTKVTACIGAGLMAVQWRGEGAPVSPKPNLDLFNKVPPKTMDANSMV